MMGDEKRAVFLSYASQDAQAAKRICESLRAAGVEVWLDADGGLEHGDEWDAKIRRQIKECVLFIPLISANTQARHEGYFRIEWELAAQRALGIASGVAFILPVVIDDTKEPDALVPDKFRTVQWTRLRPVGYAGQARLPGELSPEVLQRFLKLWSHRTGVLNHEAGSMAAGPETVAGGDPAPGIDHRRARSPGLQERSGSRALIATAAAVVVLGLGAAFWFTRSPNANLPSPGTAVAAALPPFATDKSIALLPFTNLSEDKEASAFFSDGMHDLVLTTLFNIRELRVVTLEQRDTAKTVPQIARELGVAYILDAKVLKSSNRVRIDGRLIRASDGKPVWIDSIPGDLTTQNIFDTQAKVATAIAGALQAAISPETRKLLERRPTENLAAYEAYLKGRQLPTGEGGTGTITERTTQRTQYFEQAVALDANFAAAWGELGANHAYAVFAGLDQTPARLAQADAAMARAASLAPDDPDIIRLLGTYAYYGHRDYANALEKFEKVIRLQPNNADAIYFLGLIQGTLGRWGESVANLRRATELVPDSVRYRSNLRATLLAGRRWIEAIAEDQRILARNPSDQLAQNSNLLNLQYHATGSFKESDAFFALMSPEQLALPAVIAVRKTWAYRKGDFTEWRRLDRLGGGGDASIATAMTLAAVGETAEARARVARLLPQLKADVAAQPGNHRFVRNFAQAEAVLGENDAAVRDAQKAVALMPESLDAYEGAAIRRNLAMVYAWTGDKDRAIAELTHLVLVPNGITSVYDLRTQPAFFPLRGDPRFEALLNDPKNNAPLF